MEQCVNTALAPAAHAPATYASAMHAPTACPTTCPAGDTAAGPPRQDALKSLFLETLHTENIRCVFQPIVSLHDGSIFGYEALARGPAGTPLESPEALIHLAAQHHLLLDMEHLFRYTALRAARNMPQAAKIFLNVNPNIIQDEGFRQGFTTACLTMLGIVPERVFFEITEREAIVNSHDFRRIIDHYKGQHYKIGLDDVGAGYSGLNLIADVHPHFIKLDMQLVRDIDREPIKQAIVKSMCELGALAGSFVIAEGVETEAELLRLMELNVGYAQGFFIQRPAEQARPLDEAVTRIISRENRRKNRFFGSNCHEFQVKNLCRPVPGLAEHAPAEQAAALLANLADLADLACLCVLCDQHPVGVITRARHFREAGDKSEPAALPLAERTAGAIMDADVLQVDAHTSLDVVARKAMQRPAETLYDPVVVTREGRYLGLVTIKALLEKILELEAAARR